MPRKGQQLSERAKLKRDLTEWIKLQKLPLGSRERGVAFRRELMRMNQLSESDLRRRRQRHTALGSPELHSPEWQAELERLRPIERRKRERAQPANTDLHDPDSLYWALAYLSVRISWNDERRQPRLPVRPRDVATLKRSGLRLTPEGRLTLPGQRRERQTKEHQAEARRLYRWLWRHFPGLLKACDPELRELIRHAGGIA